MTQLLANLSLSTNQVLEYIVRDKLRPTYNAELYVLSGFAKLSGMLFCIRNILLINFLNDTYTYEVDFPVTVSVIVLRRFGGLINSLRIFDSVASGKPLSSISSRSYKDKSWVELCLLHPPIVIISQQYAEKCNYISMQIYSIQPKFYTIDSN